MKIIIALLVFGIVVAIHELGHFSVAKWNKVTIHEFSIGMGPLLYKKMKAETKYSLRAIPMGGYVSMEGEDEASEDPNAFSNKTTLQRMAIIFAGPFMNFVLTIVITFLLFLFMGIPVNVAGDIVQGSPAQQMGMQVGDRIIAINDKTITQWRQVSEVINSEPVDLKIDIVRDGKQIQLTGKSNDTSGRKTIGISPSYEMHPLQAAKYSIVQTYDLSVQMLQFVGKLFTGKVDLKYVSGPVGIVRQIGTSAQKGISTILYYIGFISLNLGIMNLLPFPALDGFRFLTAFFELVTGKKPSKKAEYAVNMAGMALLIAFMLFITYKDVLNIFK